MTTTALRYLLAVLAHLPSLSVNVGNHYGDIHQHGHVCEGEDYESDPDRGEAITVFMSMPRAKELFTEAAHRGRNADDPDEVGWEMARSLELGHPEEGP